MWNDTPRLEEDPTPERQEQGTADMIRYLAVTSLHEGADPEKLAAQIDEAARIAAAGDELALVAYLRAVAALVKGDEPEDVPAAFRDQVEAVREAVHKGGIW